MEKLKPHYRLLIAEQGFAVVCRRLIKFEPE
jgi:hypothetical protein